MTSGPKVRANTNVLTQRHGKAIGALEAAMNSPKKPAHAFWSETERDQMMCRKYTVQSRKVPL